MCVCVCVCVCKHDLALNNLQGVICHKIPTNQPDSYNLFGLDEPDINENKGLHHSPQISRTRDLIVDEL